MELITFYNVENLFPPDDRTILEGSFRKSGLKNWNSKKYQHKLKNIAGVFQLMQDEFEMLPSIIGLAEISSDSVLEELIALDPLQNKYGYVHFDSLDERGVDVALLYNKERVEIVDAEPISFFFDKEDTRFTNFDTTRDVLLVKLKIQSKILNVFVLHLPSQREKANIPKREFIINEIRERILALTQEDEPVIVCGDFNENPNDENLKKIMEDKNANEILGNPFEELFFQNKFSTFHYKFGLLFDQIFLSKDFFVDHKSFQFVSAHVFNHVKISNWDKKFLNRPFRTYAGTRYLGGYSDHFPVCVCFEQK